MTASNLASTHVLIIVGFAAGLVLLVSFVGARIAKRIRQLEQENASLETKVKELTRELAEARKAAAPQAGANHESRPPRTSPQNGASVPAPGKTTPLDIPGVDVAGSIQRLGGLEHVYFSALRLFIRGHADAARDLRAALDAGEHGKAVRLAHTLKGVAGTVGATDVERAANALGMALAENASRSDIDPLLKTLGRHLNETVEQVRSRLPGT